MSKFNTTIYFPPGSGSLGVTIRECGCQRTLPGYWVPKARVFNTYGISYIAKGSAWYENGSSKRQFVPCGSCLLYFPGITSLYSPCNKIEWEEYWIHFQGPFGRMLESESMINVGNPVYLLNRSVPFLKMFQAAVAIARSRSEEAQLRLSGHLLSIMSEMFMLKKKSGMSNFVFPISTLVKQVQAHPEKSWDFHAEAEKLGTNYLALLRQFRKATGKPPHQFVNIERMKLACQFLSKGHTVQDTCMRIGMEDPFHFSRLFKNIMGEAPVKYCRKS